MRTGDGHYSTQPMPKLSEGPVVVTGATGYVGSWVVRELLSRGAQVRGTVRDPDDTKKVGFLRELADELPGSLELYAADLMRKGSFAEAIDGAVTVMHTASPFKIGKFKDPQRELVDPALEGTRNVLHQVDATESVKRVVLTSSVAAIYGDCADCVDRGGRLDESHWNETSSLEHNPYPSSKTVAAREAWKIAKAQDRWRLVVINPSFVMGPLLSPTQRGSGSYTFIRNTVKGTWRSGTMDVVSGWVDVRDVAQAHVEAAVRDDAEGRYILAAKMMTLFDAGKEIESVLGSKAKVPKRVLPKLLAYVAGPPLGYSMKYIARNVGVPLRFDNTRSRRELGIEYRPIKPALVEMAEQVLD